MSENKNSNKSEAYEKEQLQGLLGQIDSEAVKDMRAMEVNDMKTMVKGDDSKEPKITKILAFKCPKCGGNRLQWDLHTPYYRSAIVRAIEVDAEGNSAGVESGCYIGSESAFCRENYTTEYGSSWSCSKCGYVLEDDNGQPLDYEGSLVEWMLLHGEVVTDLSELKGSADEIQRTCI
ncbi:MAG: hypothetical protein ACLQPD_14770 [Desulfomonilaceae bacterium]